MNSFVERYQIIYEKDPNSKVFAPLAEAYRRMGLLDEAIDVAEKGVAKHPHFASGRVALGKCFAQKGEYAKAVEQLKVAVELSPENILAHQLLSDCYIRLGQPIEAMGSAKMVLFLNPTDKRAIELVSRLEKKIFTDNEADWAQDDDFSMEKIDEVAIKTQRPKENSRPDLAPVFGFDLAFERELALLDTRLSRGDWGSAMDQLKELLRTHPNHNELLKRKERLEEITSTAAHNKTEWIKPIATSPGPSKRERLELLLNRVQSRSKNLIS